MGKYHPDFPWDDVVFENDILWCFYDKYPVSPGHSLFVPKEELVKSIMECYRQAYMLGHFLVEFGQCNGFNVGQNVGSTAGQTIMYPHIHLIPRYEGDMKDPRGGVRHVIPEKGNYKI